MRHPWRRAARVLAFAAGGLALAAIALGLALPALLDQPRIRSALQERLSAVVQGSIAWDGLQLRLLPAPHGVLKRPRLEIPGLLSARAGRVDARLRLWPLLRGRIEVASLSAVDAQVRLELSKAPAGTADDAGGQALDPVAAYRAAAGDVARILRAFAADTELTIEQGGVELRLATLPPLHLQAVDLRARSAGRRVDLRLQCASEHWKRLSLDGSLDYGDLSGLASLEVEELNPRAWLERVVQATGARLAIAPLQVRASLQTDGTTALTARLEASTRSALLARGERQFAFPGVAVKAAVRAESPRARITLEELRLGPDKLLEGGLEVAYASGEALGRFSFDVDAARTLSLARRVLAKGEVGGLPDIESAGGPLRGVAQLVREAGQWRAGLQLRDSATSIQLRQLPWPVLVRAGTAEWLPGRVSMSAIHGSLGRSAVEGFAARLRLDKEWRVESAAGKASLDLEQLYPWLRGLPALAKALRGIPAVNGVLEAELLKASGRLAAPEFAARVVPRRVRIQANALPGPLEADGGAARITRSAVDVQQVALAMLDAKATLSGSAAGMGSPDFRVQARLGQGQAGAGFAGWALAQAKAPPQLALRTPLAFEVARLDWGPGRRVEASGRLRFDQVTTVAAELSWQPGAFDLRRLDVQEAQGSSTLTLRVDGRQVAGRFNGSTQGALLAYILKDAGRYSGRIRGDMRFAADLDRLRHASAEGQLSGEGLDLSWLAGRRLLVDRFAIEADGNAMRIGEASVSAGEDRATLRGELRRGEQGPIMDASIESEGIVLDRLLAFAESGGTQPGDAAQATLPAASQVEPRAARAAAQPGAERDLGQWWPLPITGRVALRSGFVQHGGYRVAPVALTLSLEAERARLEVVQAQLCGIALPFALEARRDGWSVAARIAAPKQPVAEMMRCLTGEHVQITGDTDFLLDLKTQGRGRDLLRNLEGTGRIEARDGRIQKFALIGNILSQLDIEDAPQAAQQAGAGAPGFRYRRIAAKGQLHDGHFKLDEGAFESPTAAMAANGTLRLADGDTRMTVLVAPLGGVDRVVRGTPVIGYVIGGTLTSIPVGVSGDIRNPLIVPLGPRAVTEELLGIFVRTIKLPSRLAEPPVRQ